MKKDPLLKRFFRSIKSGFTLLKEGHYSIVWREFLHRFYSKSTAVGLRRDLDEPFMDPPAKIDFSIRLLEEGDFDFLMEYGKVKEFNPRLVAQRKSFMEYDVPHCFVAVTPDGRPCFLQWLIGPKEDQRIQDYFGNSFPNLNHDEALLEGGYMHRSYRGLRVMPAAVSRISQKAKQIGARRVVTFVDLENIASLKGISRAGFSPYILKRDRWFLFRRYISFREISDEALSRYHDAVGSRSKQQPVATKRKVALEGEK